MRNILVALLILSACSPTPKQGSINLTLNSPPTEVSMLGEHSISTSINERDFALSSDGTELYFTISTPRSTFQTIVYCKKIKEGEWTKPEVVSFAGAYSDLEPAFSADGQTLYFASNRPVEGKTPKDFDIWKVTRTGNAWGSPENLGTVINTEGDEFYPSITKSGSLYFTAAYANGIGKEDIYRSEYINNAFQKPVVLDTAVNSRFYEFNAFVSPAEDYILFTSYGRKDDAGGGDLYISIKDAEGKWKTAVNLVTLNSKQLDYCPYVSPDGKSLFFTSERHQLPNSFPEVKATYESITEINNGTLNTKGNIYWVDFAKILNALK